MGVHAVHCCKCFLSGVCAGVRGEGSGAQLRVATELSAKRRRSLERQYPEASLFAQAGDVEAFRVQCDILGVSWPCQFYSTAGPAVGAMSREARARWLALAWRNTELVCRVLALACTQSGGPPLVIVLEN